MRKLGIYLIIFALFCGSVLAQNPQPIQPVSQSDQLIRQQHEATRDFCEAQWSEKVTEIEDLINEEADGYLSRVKEALWIDRLINFGSMLMAAFFAFSLRSLFDLTFKRKKQFIDRQEAAFEQSKPKKPKKRRKRLFRRKEMKIPKPTAETSTIQPQEGVKFHY